MFGIIMNSRRRGTAKKRTADPRTFTAAELAEARLDEARWWLPEHNRFTNHDSGLACGYCKRIADLEAAARAARGEGEKK